MKLSQHAMDEAIGELVKQAVAENGIPGLALYVLGGPTYNYARGFGVMKNGENQPVTTKTIFHLASVAKPFVATGILQLVEQGKLSLSDRVVDILPYFNLGDRSEQITIQQMLTHTAGMPDVEDYEWEKPQYDDEALERWVRSLSNRTLISEPGAQFAYSNIGFEVLGHVIARVSGKTFEDYMQTHLFTPLGMQHSTFLIQQVDQACLASPHIVNAAGQVEVSQIFPYNRRHAPSSTLYTSVEDMSRWVQANLNRGEIDGARILNPASYNLLWQPYHEINASPDSPMHVSVGLSWFQMTYRGYRFVGHGGADVGFNSFMILSAERDEAVVALMNITLENFNIDMLGMQIIDLLLDAQ